MKQRSKIIDILILIAFAPLALIAWVGLKLTKRRKPR